MSASSPGDDVRAVELRRHLHRELRPAHRRLGGRRVGDRADEVAAQREEHVDLAVAQALHRLQGVGAVLARHREAELGLERGEEALGHPLPDAHGAVALHVAVPADGRGARARLADVAAEQQEVDDLLDRRDGLPLLGQAHRPGDDHAVGGEVLGGEVVDLVRRRAGGGEHRRLVECRRGARGRRRGRTVCSARNVVVEHGARRGILGIEDAPRHRLQQRHVAARADLQEPVGESPCPCR